MNFVKFLLIITLATLIPGQIIRIPISTVGAISLSDVSVLVTAAIFIFSKLYSQKTILLPSKIFLSGLIFIFSLIISSVLSLNIFTFSQVISGSLFLVRFVLYFSIIIVVINTIRVGEIKKWLDMILFFGLIFSGFGLLQFLLIPDLRFLANFGWDPHVNRLVSTLIDPNFTGFLLVLFLSVSLVSYIKTDKKVYAFISFIFLISIVLTFSRSSYLALLVSISMIGIIKSPKVLIYSLLIFILSFIFIPRVKNRIIGAVTLDDTAQARIESWQNAFQIINNNIIFGVGFNNYRLAQQISGNFNFNDPHGGHSGAGTDSSFLLIAATSGIFGLIFFLNFLFNLFKVIVVNFKNNFLKLAVLSSFSALLVHSQFVNSIFFPQIMLYFWFLIGLSLSQKK